MEKTPKEEIEELLKTLDEDQLKDVMYFMAAIIAKRKGVDPRQLINVVNNWEAIQRAVNILKRP